MKYPYIAIEGNIGAGKTTLSKLLAQQLGARLVLEQFSENPFLPAFYKNPDKVAFALELSFLADRYNQLKKDLINLDLFAEQTIADYFIHKCLIFAGNNLREDELLLYQRLFNIIAETLPPPDLLIYLYTDFDRLQQNIKQRGRTYESDIKPNYLEKIHHRYMEFIYGLPQQRTLILDMKNVDFLHDTTKLPAFIHLLEKDYPPGVTLVSI